MSEEMKEWQHDLPLEDLKQWAAIFKTAHGPHVYGAFGLVKEREVAEACDEGRMVQFAQDGAVGAALIYRRLKFGRTRHSYYEKPISFLAGEPIITAF